MTASENSHKKDRDRKDKLIPISVYVPCFNSSSTIIGCIKGIATQSYSPDEIIILDDCSTDNTHDVVIDACKRYPNISFKIVSNDNEMGLAATRNKGLLLSRNNYVACLDADCIPDKHWLKNLVLSIKDSDKIAGIGGRLIEKYTDSPADSWRCTHMKQDWGLNRQVNPGHLFGCNKLLKKDAVKKSGFYNPSYKTNFEDIDISKKLRKKGFGLIYEPKAKVYHYKKDSVRSLIRRYWKWTEHTSPKMKDTRSMLRRFGHSYAKIKYCAKKDIACRSYKNLMIDALMLPAFVILDLKSYVDKKR